MRTLLLICFLSLGLPGVVSTVAPAAAAKKEKKKEAPKEGVIVWKVQPESVVIFLDNKKIGTAGKAQPTKTKGGMHMIRLEWGKDQAEEPIEVKAGESSEFQYTFEDSGKKPEGSEGGAQP